jgi:4-amino-4-deoxy-L-arabinose transferase-like glycosyltransferase
MNDNKHNQIGQDSIKDFHERRFHWKRIHHSWIFWVFLFLMLVGILFYVMTVDFSSVPQRQLKEQEKNRTL